MNPQKISKYDYHNYVLFAFFLLTISALFAIFSLDFTPTDHVKICAFISFSRSAILLICDRRR